jgi:hypothetical protein
MKFFIVLLFLKTKLNKFLVSSCFLNYFSSISCDSISNGGNFYTGYFVIVVIGDEYCVKRQETGEYAGAICAKGKKALI